MKQSLSQKLQQKFTPQQILLMKLIELPAMELEARLKKEVEENPVIEEGLAGEEEDGNDPEEDVAEDADEAEFYHRDEEEVRTTVSGPLSESHQFFSLSQRRSFQDELMEQISVKLSGDRERIIARFLIGSLDDAGYLRREIASLVDDLAFTQSLDCTEEEVKEVIAKLQSLDPPGVGARDLRESLLIQIRRHPHPDLITRNAEYILEHLFDDFSHRRYSRIMERTGISEEDLRKVSEEIKALNPKPGEPQAAMEQMKMGITPDFLLTVTNDELSILLNNSSLPVLKINKSYIELIESKKKPDERQGKETMQFLRSKVESAKWFIEALRQRGETMMRTMEAIATIQREYFITGDERKIKPMILKDIASVVGLDISTVSRVVNSKYVQTPYGIFQLRKFFSEGFTMEGGEEVSTIQVKGILREIIEKEESEKPLRDEELVEILKERGYPIARRTVAKYREQLGIPVARLRKKL